MAEFCKDCGTTLPEPGREPQVTCLLCGRSVPVEVFMGVERTSFIVFNKRKTNEEIQQEQDLPAEALTGPKVDRKCKECGHEEMTYTTKQTRSIDEGQTIFYCCLKCKAVETEFS